LIDHSKNHKYVKSSYKQPGIRLHSSYKGYKSGGRAYLLLSTLNNPAFPNKNFDLLTVMWDDLSLMMFRMEEDDHVYQTVLVEYDKEDKSTGE
jgi:hypothetical protein